MKKSENDLYQALSDIDPSRGAVNWARDNASHKVNALTSLPDNLQLPPALKSLLKGGSGISPEARDAGTLLVKLIFAQAVYWRRASDAFMHRACEDPRNRKRMLSLEDAEQLCKLNRRRDELVDQLVSKLLSSGWPQIQLGQMDGIERAVDKEQSAISAISAKIDKIWRAGPKHRELDLKYPWANSEHESVDLLRALGVVETRFKTICRVIRARWSEQYEFAEVRRALKIERDELRRAPNIERDELPRVLKTGLARFKTLCRAKRGRWVRAKDLLKLKIDPAKFETRWEKCLGRKSGRKKVYTWEVALECLQARLRAMSAVKRVEVATKLLVHNPPETGEWKSSDALAELGKIIDDAMKGKAICKGRGARPARRKVNH